MTWNQAEAAVIETLLQQSAATNANVNEIKEAIVGSIKDGGKPGLQDTVRDLSSEIGVARGELITHQAANAKDHLFIKRLTATLGIVSVLALLLNFDKALPVIGALVKMIVKIFT